MAKTEITNLLRDQPLDFVVGMKDGVQVTESVRPGETKSIEVDMSSAHVQGKLLAGAIAVGKGGAKAAQVATEPSTVNRVK